MRHHFIPALLLLLTLDSASAQTEPLGRLFLTAPQRAALDRQRQLNPGYNVNFVDTETPLTVNGEVRRSNGRSTRWINGEARQDALPQVNGLPVGDTLHPGTGEREGLLGGGRIVVKPANPGKAAN